MLGHALDPFWKKVDVIVEKNAAQKATETERMEKEIGSLVADALKTADQRMQEALDE